MQARCFECAAIIEADTLPALTDAFVRHGREQHDWPYPEQAQRNYAQNYAEAVERLSPDTERLPVIGAVAVHPVEGHRIDDWLRLFDRDAFAGNPDWAACYCLEPHVPATPDMPERPWRQNRAAMVDRFRAGTTFGYLAYVDDRPAGWVNASRRADYLFYKDVDPTGPSPVSVIVASCFVVAPPFRRHGVAGALLDRVIADAAGRGASWIEGYPRNSPDPSDAGHFRGPRPMFESRGFGPVATRERDTIMRRAVV